MEDIDLPPPYSAVTNVTIPSAEVLISPQEIVVKEHKNNVEEPLVGHVFEDKSVRTGFIQKVLISLLHEDVIVLSIMCGMTIMYFSMTPSWGSDGQLHETPMHFYSFISVCAFLVTMCFLIFCDKARTTNPYKITMFVIYPIEGALFVSFSTMNYTISETFIVWAFHCITIFVLLLCSIFTFQSNWEFTTKTGALISGVVMFTLFGIVAIVSPHSYIFITSWLTVASFVECLYTVWDIEQRTPHAPISSKDIVLGVSLIHIDYIHYLKLCIKKCIEWMNCFKDWINSVIS